MTEDRRNNEYMCMEEEKGVAEGVRNAQEVLKVNKFKYFLSTFQNNRTSGRRR